MRPSQSEAQPLALRGPRNPQARDPRAPKAHGLLGSDRDRKAVDSWRPQNRNLCLPLHRKATVMLPGGEKVTNHSMIEQKGLNKQNGCCIGRIALNHE
jgi:hypothetical protein